MTTLIEAAKIVQQFQGASLTAQLASIERGLKDTDRGNLINVYSAVGITPLLLESALVLKQAAAQVNVLVHAAGILLSPLHFAGGRNNRSLVARCWKYRQTI